MLLNQPSRLVKKTISYGGWGRINCFGATTCVKLKRDHENYLRQLSQFQTMERVKIGEITFKIVVGWLKWVSTRVWTNMDLVARSRIVQFLLFPRPGKCRKCRLPEAISYTYSLQGARDTLLTHYPLSRKPKKYILSSMPAFFHKAHVTVNSSALKHILHNSQMNTRISTRSRQADPSAASSS